MKLHIKNILLISIFLIQLPIHANRVGTSSGANSNALQADGKIVMSGYSDNNFLVERFNTNGSIDTTFGSNGAVTTSFGTLPNTAVSYAVAIQADGKIIAAGNAVTNIAKFALARYTTTGVLDTTFGGTGTVTTTIGDGSVIYAIAIQPADQRIVAVGSTVVNGTPQFALARYNTDGTLDTAFGTAGIVTTLIANRSAAFAVALQADGKIVVAGWAVNSDTDFVVARYNTNGTLDTATFGAGTGFVTTNVGSFDQATDVLIQADGSIIASGFAQINQFNNFALVRYSSNGVLDAGFGSGGIVTTAIQKQAMSLASALQTDNKIILAGQVVSFDNVGQFGMARYSTTGGLDGTFGITGIVITPLGDDASAQSISLQTDGKIVLAGVVTDEGNNGPALARYNPTDGSLDTTFGYNGIACFGGPTGAAGFGNTVRVDKVYGSDTLGQRNAGPVLTVNKALSLAQPNDVVWIFPGFYSESIVIPTGVAIRGLDRLGVTIGLSGVTGPTDLVTMGQTTRLEDVTLQLTSATGVQLRGIVFPANTATTSTVVDVGLNVDNSSAATTNTSNVYGIHSNGTGIATQLTTALRGSTVTVSSSGNGTKRGILIDNNNTFNIRDAKIFISSTGTAGSGSYFGVETNSTGAQFNALASKIQVVFPLGSASATGADISQTNGTINLIGVDLVTSTANGLGFTSQIKPSIVIWGSQGKVTPNATQFLYPGNAATSSATEIWTKINQQTLAFALTVVATAGPGSTRIDTFTLRKNGVDTPLSVSIVGLNASGVNNSKSVTFQPGDIASLKISTVTSSVTSDPVVTVGFY